MNICKCGCGQDSIYCTAFGPNTNTLNAQKEKTIEEVKNSEENDTVDDNNKETVEEVVSQPTECYDLTNVPKNVTINYEAGKKWLDKTFSRYTVRVNHNEDDIPYEIRDGKYEDPDEQLCEHYGIDYDLVNCIEALY